MPHDDLMAELDRRRTDAARMGGGEKLAKRAERNDLNAEQRLEALIDKDSFFELGLLGASSFSDEAAASTPRDGKIVGFGKIDGRDIGVVVNDFTTKGASTGAINSKKMGYVRTTCVQRGIPFVHVGESTGARLPDAMGSKGMGQMLGNDTSQFRRMREVPYASAALNTS
ncbi:MAG: methylmalonyl-CoA carboxyltransferase, partial [Hyphomicrobiales bacterium]|nr:methylmalonyl-CoA carboxyltransferase [Hyphomicrobiales bacterium]